MNRSVPLIRGHPITDVYREVNRLRKGEGHDEIGALAFAVKLAGYHESKNPRVAQALANLDKIKNGLNDKDTTETP